MSEIERLLRAVRRRSPAVWVEGFSAGEIHAIARESGLGVGETLARLRDAGLSSIAGNGLGPTNESADGIGQLGCGLEEWVEVHRAAHKLGMQTTAAVTFCADDEDTDEARIDLLDAMRRLQEETGGFAAFAPRGFQPRGAGTGYGAGELTAVDFLKTLAISRMMLENVENIEAGGAGRGLKVLQTTLRFGANDAGWLIDEASGATGAGEEDLRRVIRDVGFRPVERDAPYRTMFTS